MDKYISILTEQMETNNINFPTHICMVGVRNDVSHWPTLIINPHYIAHTITTARVQLKTARAGDTMEHSNQDGMDT